MVEKVRTQQNNPEPKEETHRAIKLITEFGIFLSALSIIVSVGLIAMIQSGIPALENYFGGFDKTAIQVLVFNIVISFISLVAFILLWRRSKWGFYLIVVLTILYAMFTLSDAIAGAPTVIILVLLVAYLTTKREYFGL
ncbi:MAG: hypothetical protein HY518_01625 [Candidatus Aenigmarchaeota archaeon]|nr:hypothetical protein [Candidatus Aenigmarchaeota archaeon]